MTVKPKLLVLSVIPVIILLCVPASLCDDLVTIKKLMLYDQPMHIMPFDDAVETHRGYSFQSASETHLPLWYVYFDLWEKDDTTAVQYMTGEMMRLAKIMQEVFNSNQIDMLREMLKDQERTKHWLEARRKRLECIDRIFNKNDRSPEIGTTLIEILHEVERLGFEQWSCESYETTADYFFALGQDEKAFGYLEKSYELGILTGSYSRISHASGRIGEYYRRKGDFEKARDAFSESLRHCELIHDHYNKARALSFMARLSANMGDFIEAERLYLQSIEECGYITDAVCELQKLYLLASLYNSFGHLEKAEYLTERAILLAEKNLQQCTNEHALRVRESLTNYLAYSLSLLAQVQLKGGKVNEAVLTMEKALKTSRHFIDRLHCAELERAMGEAYLAAGRLGEASRNLQNSLRASRKLQNRRLEAECLIVLAELRIAQGKLDEADDLLMDADDIATEERLHMLMLDTERLRAQSDMIRGRYRPAIDHLERAVARFDTESASILYEEDKHAFAEKMNTVYDNIINMQDEHTHDSDSVTYWVEKCRHRPHSGVCRADSEFMQGLACAISERDWIPDDAVIIQYIITTDRLIAIATERGGTIRHSIPMSPEHLSSQIQEFFETCYGFRNNPSLSGKKIERMAENFYTVLLEPFSGILETKSVLYFIPARPLDRLPFSALMKPSGECRFLVEDKLIITAPNLLDIFWAIAGSDPHMTHRHFASPLLIGDPLIAPAIRRLFPDLNELPHTAKEIEAVERILGTRRTLSGADATPGAFLRSAEGSDLIHIATHTVAHPPYSGKSALVLSLAGRDSTEGCIERSLVSEDDIRNLSLDGTRLVVISSCESAPGAARGTVTGPGLAAGFLHAGADAVIATIWPIEDDITGDIIAAFYRELLRGTGDPSQALCTVQRSIIQEDRSRGVPNARIHQWAPFIAMGSTPEHTSR